MAHLTCVLHGKRVCVDGALVLHRSSPTAPNGIPVVCETAVVRIDGREYFPHCLKGQAVKATTALAKTDHAHPIAEDITKTSDYKDGDWYMDSDGFFWEYFGGAAKPWEPTWCCFSSNDETGRYIPDGRRVQPPSGD